MVDGSAVTPTNLASNVYRFANLSAGPHTISIYDVNGGWWLRISRSTVMKISVKDTITVPLCNAGTNIYGEIILSPSGGPSPSYSYQWTGSKGSGIKDSIGKGVLGQDTIFSLTDRYYIRMLPGDYHVTVSSGGCQDTTSFFGIKPKVTLTVTLGSDSIDACYNQPLTLTAHATSTTVSHNILYTWYPSNNLSSATDSTVILTTRNSAVYNVQVTDSNCINVDSIKIKLKPVYDLRIGSISLLTKAVGFGFER